MDKKGIVDHLSKKIKYTEEQQEIIRAIEETKKELDRARQYFEAVKEPMLVDYAIYMEQAAKSRFSYLLEEAKRQGIKADYTSMVQYVEAM